MDKNIVTVNRDRLFSEYPDLNIGLKSEKSLTKIIVLFIRQESEKIDLMKLRNCGLY